MHCRPLATRTARPTAPSRMLAVLLGAAVLLPLSGLPASANTGATAREVGPSDVARADERVRAAQTQVEALRAQVEQTAAVLAEGTARLEQGQAEFARTQAEQTTAEAAADRALQRAGAAKAKLAVVVSAAYRSPVPRTVQMALTSGPDEIVDVIVARHDLDRVQGDSQDLLAEATAARLEAEQARRYAVSLTATAAAQQKALDAEVAQLADAARRSEQTLTAASADLQAAQSDQQQVLALTEAQTRAREQERLARAAAGSYIIATCAGAPAGPQANGLLDPSTLCPLDDQPGHALEPAAATAFNALNAAHQAERGTSLCVGDSYRSYAAQVAVYAAKPALAAVPGRSNHGWGLAVDLSCGVQAFGSPAHQWMRANAGRFGWFHPEWAQAGGSRPEAWHWEFARP